MMWFESSLFLHVFLIQYFFIGCISNFILSHDMTPHDVTPRDTTWHDATCHFMTSHDITASTRHCTLSEYQCNTNKESEKNQDLKIAERYCELCEGSALQGCVMWCDVMQSVLDADNWSNIVAQLFLQYDIRLSRRMTSTMTWHNIGLHKLCYHITHDITSHDIKSHHMTSHDTTLAGLDQDPAALPYDQMSSFSEAKATGPDVTTHDITSHHSTWHHTIWCFCLFLELDWFDMIIYNLQLVLFERFHDHAVHYFVLVLCFSPVMSAWRSSLHLIPLNTTHHVHINTTHHVHIKTTHHVHINTPHHVHVNTTHRVHVNTPHHAHINTILNKPTTSILMNYCVRNVNMWPCDVSLLFV